MDFLVVRERRPDCESFAFDSKQQRSRTVIAAGDILANVAKIDFNRSELEVVTLDALDSLSNIERLEAYGKGIVDPY